MICQPRSLCQNSLRQQSLHSVCVLLMNPGLKLRGGRRQLNRRWHPHRLVKLSQCQLQRMGRRRFEPHLRGGRLQRLLKLSQSLRRCLQHHPRGGRLQRLLMLSQPPQLCLWLFIMHSQQSLLILILFLDNRKRLKDRDSRRQMASRGEGLLRPPLRLLLLTICFQSWAKSISVFWRHAQQPISLHRPRRRRWRPCLSKTKFLPTWSR